MAAGDPKQLAAEAKARGNGSFAKKSKQGYEEAIAAYNEAIQHDPTDHIFHANICACHLELAKDCWEPQKKVEAYAAALAAARRCTELCPTWAKGFVRRADAEFELVQAVQKWEERQATDRKWREERKASEEKLKESSRGGEEGGDKGDSYFDREERELDAAAKLIAESASFGSCEGSCRRVWELDPQNASTRARLQALRDAGFATDEAQDRAMRDQAAAAPLKAEGNGAFSAKRFKDAVEHYTRALALDPFDHVFYSNRSACYAEEHEFGKALRDADRCTQLNPQFAKGYSRRALALFHLGRYPESEAAAQAGLAIDAGSAPLQEMLKQAQVETAETPEVQRHMHKLREDKRQEQKLQDLLKGLGGGVQVMTPDSLRNGLGGMAGGFGDGFGGGGGGGGGLEGLFGGNSGKARMTDHQMRAMARAMAQSGSSQDSDAKAAPAAPGASPKSPESAAPDGPKVFSPM